MSLPYSVVNWTAFSNKRRIEGTLRLRKKRSAQFGLFFAERGERVPCLGMEIKTNSIVFPFSLSFEKGDAWPAYVIVSNVSCETLTYKICTEVMG